MPIFLIFFILFVIWLNVKTKRGQNNNSEWDTDYWEKEREANFVRRKDISGLDYITISEDAMYQLVTLKAISNALMQRVRRNYRFVISFNFGLIILGVLGVLAPATSALLHNTSTLCISMHSMTNLLKDEEKKH